MEAAFRIAFATRQRFIDRPLPAHDGTFTECDVTGSHGTSDSAINASGVVAGDRFDSNGVTHGFIRNASGNITVFDPKGTTDTIGSGINKKGTVVATP